MSEQTQSSLPASPLDASIQGTATPTPSRRSSRWAVWLVVVSLLVLGSWYARKIYLASNTLLPDYPEITQLDPKVVEMGKQTVNIRAALVQDPDNLTLRWQLANLYQQLQLPQQAAQELQAIVRINPKDVLAQVGLANIDMANGRIQEAEQKFRSITQKFNTGQGIGDAWGGLAATLYHQGRYMEAEKAAREGLRRLKDSANLLFIRSASIIEMAMRAPRPRVYAEPVEGALEGMRNVLSVWPDKSEVYYKIGRGYIALEKWREAIKYLGRSKEINADNSQVDAMLVYALTKSNQESKALEVLTQALAKHKDNADLYLYHGRLLRKQPTPEAYQAAYEAFKKAAQLRPEEALLQQEYGTACMRTGRTEEARLAFERALTLNAHLPYPYQQLALIYRRKGDLKVADRLAADANGVAANSQQLQQIQRLLQDIVEKDPKDPRVAKLHIILADRYMQMERYTMARDEYLVVLQSHPKNKRALQGVARAGQALKKSPLQPALQ
jgi:tetratricopeptide (TPR) repeat protein